MKWLPYVTLVCCVMSFPVVAKMITAAVGDFPPYVSQSDKNANIASEIVVEAYKAVGYQVSLRWVPWKRAFEELKNGKVDISYPWRRTNEREQYFFYSEGLYQSKEVFHHRKDMMFTWNTLSDLKSYTIGGSLGYAHVNELSKAGLKVNTAKNDTLNLTKLYKKRIDIFPLDHRVGAYLLSSLPEEYQEMIVADEKALSITENHVITSKIDKERGQKLIDDFNTGLSIIKDNGVMDSILSRYK